MVITINNFPTAPRNDEKAEPLAQAGLPHCSCQGCFIGETLPGEFRNGKPCWKYKKFGCQQPHLLEELGTVSSPDRLMWCSQKNWETKRPPPYRVTSKIGVWYSSAWQHGVRSRTLGLWAYDSHIYGWFFTGTSPFFWGWYDHQTLHVWGVHMEQLSFTTRKSRLVAPPSSQRWPGPGKMRRGSKWVMSQKR